MRPNAGRGVIPFGHLVGLRRSETCVCGGTAVLCPSVVLAEEVTPSGHNEASPTLRPCEVLRALRLTIRSGDSCAPALAGEGAFFLRPENVSLHKGVDTAPDMSPGIG